MGIQIVWRVAMTLALLLLDWPVVSTIGRQARKSGNWWIALSALNLIAFSAVEFFILSPAPFSR